jgi:predicted nucleic acid-binding protein
VRIFLDANVIFAATISPDGACAALLDVCQALVHDVVTSGFAFEEAGDERSPQTAGVPGAPG